MTDCGKSRKDPATEIVNDRDAISITFEWFEIEGKMWHLPNLWKKQAEGFFNFKSRPDDVYIITQPRSGTTLTQELVWLLMNNLDFETSKKFSLPDRAVELPISLFPWIWSHCRIVRPSREDPKTLESVPVDVTKPSYEVYADLPSPRVFKSHLPVSVHKKVLDSGSKIIYVLRNPKDMLISRARFLMSGSKPFYTGTVESFIETFITDPDHLDNCVCAWGPYWQHVKEAFALRDHPNMLIIHYEDSRTNLPAAIKKIAAFLGKSYTDEQIEKLAAHLDIDAFRKNPMVNKLPGCGNIFPSFVGEGKVKGWKEVLSPELEAKVDRWIEENIKDTGIVYPNF